MAAQSLTLNLEYNMDSTLPFSAEEYLTEYLVDIPIRGLGGGKMTRDKIEEKIKKHTEQLENFLDIKVPKQIAQEEHDYEKEKWMVWGFVKCNYLITKIKSLKGKFNSTEQIEFQNDWLNVKSKDDSAARNLHIVPVTSGSITYSGNAALFVFFKNYTYIPNYWHVCYITGFDKTPRDIQEVIGKYTTISVMAVLGDVAFGAGIASKSISIDGLSQSIGTTQSAENSLYSARIRQLAGELEKFDLPRVRARYKALGMEAL